jgi:SpoU rRNA methylase family enzyme
MKIPKIVKIRCECGDELLLLPDLKEMGKAIEDHVELHLQSLKAPSCTPAEAERLKDMLIAQALAKVSQSEDEENQ